MTTTSVRTNASLRGESHPLHKLTADDVWQIRALADSISQYELAQRFGVSPATIGAVLKRDVEARLTIDHDCARRRVGAERPGRIGRGD